MIYPVTIVIENCALKKGMNTKKTLTGPGLNGLIQYEFSSSKNQRIAIKVRTKHLQISLFENCLDILNIKYIKYIIN